MHALGECFRQTVRERLNQYRTVIVMFSFEILGDRIDSNTGGHREGAQIVLDSQFLRGEKIGERAIGATSLLAIHLLAKRMNNRDNTRSTLIGEHFDIVFSDSIRGPKADHTTRGQPLLANNSLQHSLSVVEQTTRRLSHHIVIKNIRKAPASSQV